MPEPDLSTDFALAEAAAREAGTLAMAHFHARPDSWMKGDNSPVSEADHAVDRLLKDRLMSRRPDYGWLSEETADSEARLPRKRIWVVDPIDGTRAFLKGRSEWVVSVALVEDGMPVVGHIYNPLREEMYSAMSGGGATLNGATVSVSSCAEIAGARLVANSYQLNSRRWKQGWPETETVRFNALAYRIAVIASGTFDAALAFSRFHEWDVAAADIIIREAGGMLTDFAGDAFIYNQPDPRHTDGIAANPALHAAISGFISTNLLPPTALAETET